MDVPYDVIAIDGPSGVGKSTISKQVAEILGRDRLDTGAIYRAVTAAVLDAGVDPTDAEAASEIARRSVVEFARDGSVFVDSHDVSEEIRGRRVTSNVSAVSAHPGVRRALVAHQRHCARTGAWVVEGRDIGTVVFPDAPLKIYLTASAQVRARRRAAQVGETNLATVKSDIERRDEADSTRVDSPLRPADDAVEVNTTAMTADEATRRVIDLWADLEARR